MASAGEYGVLVLERRAAPTGELELRFAGRLDDRRELAAGSLAEERATSVEELLRARYARLGEAFLDGVRGSFALAVRDPSARRLLAARTGMGGQLASYVLRDDLFAVSVGLEGAEPLLRLPGVSGELDRLRLEAFFAFDEVRVPTSYFRDVRNVAPGEMVVVDTSGVRTRYLPKPSLELRLQPESWEEGVELFAAALEGAVRRAVGDHRRVAVWLSGGLDSTPVAALAVRLLGSAAGGREGSLLHGISWRVTDSQADEGAFVDAFSRGSGVPVAWVDCDDAVPFADFSSWPVHPDCPDQTGYRWFHERSYARSRELGATLVLTGFGGDSLYGDARRWFWGVLAAEGPGPAIDRLREVAERNGWPRTLRSELVAGLLWKGRRLRRVPHSWLTAETRRRLKGMPPWPPNVARARRPRQAERILSIIDADGEHQEAWFAARFGLEIATPLRDAGLAQLVLALPDHFLTRGLESRAVLRAAIRGLVPEMIRQRTGKARFVAVLLRGLEHQRLGWAWPLLRSPEALWRGIVEPEAVSRWMAGDVRDNSDRIGLLQCLFAELWRFTRAGGELATLAAGR